MIVSDDGISVRWNPYFRCIWRGGTLTHMNVDRLVFLV